MRLTIHLIIPAIALCSASYAQVSSDTPVEKSPTVVQPAEATRPADAKPKKEKKIRQKEHYRFMANVHGGVGINRFFGDVTDSEKIAIHTLGNRPLFNFGIGANVTNYLELNIDGMYGWLNGNENNYGAHRNFQAEVFGVGANLVYNFHNVLRSPVGITPFISLGATYSDFRVFSDLQDGNGNTYHYWDDGLIRNVSQELPETPDIQVIERDFEYETRLSQSPLTSVAFPVGVGLDFNASRKVAVRLGATYYFSATDLIDNAASGENGFFSNDGWLTTHLSFIYRFDPFKKKAPKFEFDDSEYGDFAELESVDSDGDGVVDFLDQCSGTLKGIPVDAKGCPFDRDGDGIADYKDKQLNTPSGALVDPDGVALSYQDIYKKYGEDTTSLARSEATPDYVLSQKDKNPSYTVHLGTFVNDDIPTQLKKKLSEMPGLVERKINDSTSVFTVGVFSDFSDAEAKQNELREKGVAQAFGVSDKAVKGVASDLSRMDRGESYYERPKIDGVDDKDVLVYGVELREYRLRIELDKLSRLIAQHGVEMKVTTGGMKLYTIGNFKTYADAVKLQQEVMTLGVKDTEIAAKFNNQPMEIEKAREKEGEMNKE
ncbi:MAG: hypothetical protein K9J06_15575 [Flavobacteriales bacterium]|nr:hypothetical protein [Flavobacteriales bacterium]